MVLPVTAFIVILLITFILGLISPLLLMLYYVMRAEVPQNSSSVRNALES